VGGGRQLAIRTSRRTHLLDGCLRAEPRKFMTTFADGFCGCGVITSAESLREGKRALPSALELEHWSFTLNRKSSWYDMSYLVTQQWLPKILDVLVTGNSEGWILKRAELHCLTVKGLFASVRIKKHPIFHDSTTISFPLNKSKRSNKHKSIHGRNTLHSVMFKIFCPINSVLKTQKTVTTSILRHNFRSPT
jgi:hypothetical protein